LTIKIKEGSLRSFLMRLFPQSNQGSHHQMYGSFSLSSGLYVKSSAYFLLSLDKCKLKGLEAYICYMLKDEFFTESSNKPISLIQARNACK